MDDQSAPKKKLVRSTSGKMIAGVCAGLAEYFGIDPVIMRVAFVLLALVGSGGIWLYIILWIVVPEGDSAGAAGPTGGTSS